MARTATIKVSASSNAPEVERAFARVSPAILRNTQEAVQAAGWHLKRALEALDNSSDEWSTPLYTRTALGAAVEVKTLTDKPGYQELGTPPHPIAARRAKALSFYWNKRQGRFFFDSVNHPGRTPKPFLDRAAKFAERQILSEFDRAMKEAIE